MKRKPSKKAINPSINALIKLSKTLKRAGTRCSVCEDEALSSSIHKALLLIAEKKVSVPFRTIYDWVKTEYPDNKIKIATLQRHIRKHEAELYEKAKKNIPRSYMYE